MIHGIYLIYEFYCLQKNNNKVLRGPWRKTNNTWEAENGGEVEVALYWAQLGISGRQLAKYGGEYAATVAVSSF